MWNDKKKEKHTEEKAQRSKVREIRLKLQDRNQVDKGMQC